MLETLTTNELAQLLTLCKARLRCQAEPPNTLPRPIVREVWQMARLALVRLWESITDLLDTQEFINV